MKKKLLKRVQEVLDSLETYNCHDAGIDKTRTLIRDLRAYQMELERQNEEIRRLHLELFMQSFEAISVVQKERIIDVNPAWLRMHGFVDKREALGMDVLQIIHPDDREILIERRKLPEKRRKGYEIRDIRKDGGTIFVEIYSNLVSLGGEEAMVTFLRNITERREAERALRASYKQIEQIKLEWELSVDSLHELLFLLDKGYHIIRINRAVEAWGLGSPVDAKGKELHGLLHPACTDSRCRLQAFLVDSIVPIEHGQETAWEGKDSILGKDVWIRMRPFAGRDRAVEGGWESFAVAVIYDISERKEAERTLQETFRKLSELQGQLIHTAKMAAVGQLAGGIVHEIKNPLAIILSGMEYLDSYLGCDPTLKEVAGMVKSATLRADKIVKDLLGFSRNTQAVFTEVHLPSVIDESLALVEHQIGLRNIKVVREFAPFLPKVLVDPDKMKQVFINLAVNAVDAMMPRGGSLTIGVTRFEDRVRVSFCDTGCGIGEAALEKIFDPFFTTKEKGSNAGLGLAITRQIIEAHSGSIRVESEPGKGTKMIIELSLAKGEHEDDPC